MRLFTDETIVEFTGDYQTLARDLAQILHGTDRELPSRQDPWWDTSEVADCITTLLDGMNSLAPEGYYFGSHPEWADSFGYWKQGVSYVDEG